MRPPATMRVQDIVDSSFADNPDTRRSTSAYLGTIGGSALVTWWSKGQKVVACSSTEAEYMTLSDGAKDTTFIANLLLELMEIERPSIYLRITLVQFFSHKIDKSVQEQNTLMFAIILYVRRWKQD